MIESKRRLFRDFDVSKCDSYQELTEFMSYTVDEIMLLNIKLGYQISREDLVQLLHRLARNEICMEAYYAILEETIK